MILAALKQKLRARGPLGFPTADAELAVACAVIGLEAFAIAGAAATVAVAAVVSSPALALELLTRPRAGSDVPSSTDDFAAEETSCRNAEEPGS